MKWLAVLLFCFQLRGHAQADGGGRDVSIELFTAKLAQSVTVSPVGREAWWAACEKCHHVPLVAPVRLPSTREIRAGGPIPVRDEEHAQLLTANGGWHPQVTNHATIEVVLTLPGERYVEAVLIGETQAGDPGGSLRTMAVVARTIALNAATPKSMRVKPASEICDSAACQAMKLGTVPDAVSEAVRSNLPNRRMIY